jgi:hypothetical protein
MVEDIKSQIEKEIKELLVYYKKEIDKYVNLREKDWKLDPRNRYFELQAKLEGIKIGEQIKEQEIKDKLHIARQCTD